MITRFARDNRGVTVIEFALVAPVLLLMLMGFLDLSYNLWVRSVLYGTVQKAGRDSALETGPASQNLVDANVTEAIHSLAREAKVHFTRENFRSFDDVGKAEDFTDKNNNGRRDPKECFTDANGNGAWDASRGASGQGGANDVTKYTVRISYSRLFPLSQMAGLPPVVELQAATILKNQPYDQQGARVNKVICS